MQTIGSGSPFSIKFTLCIEGFKFIFGIYGKCSIFQIERYDFYHENVSGKETAFLIIEGGPNRILFKISFPSIMSCLAV
jgi:hypothetical protein